MTGDNRQFRGPELWEGLPPVDQRIYMDPNPSTDLRDLVLSIYGTSGVRPLYEE